MALLGFFSWRVDSFKENDRCPDPAAYQQAVGFSPVLDLLPQAQIGPQGVQIGGSTFLQRGEPHAYAPRLRGEGVENGFEEGHGSMQVQHGRG